MKRIISFIFGAMLTCSAFAQDYTFSNHNVVPFNLNPALVGNANAMRFSLDYRMQWPTLDNKYNTVRLSYDQNFYSNISSVGISYTHDNEAGVVGRNEFSAIYSHNIRIDDGVYVRLGVQGSFMLNTIDENLTFDDQFVKLGYILPSSVENFENTKTAFMDFSFGAEFVLENKLNVGAAVYHIAEPNNGFNNEESSQLKRRYAIHVNYMHDLESRAGLWGRRNLSSNYIFGTVSYQQQEFVYESLRYAYKQAHIGVGALADPIIMGVSYKHDFNDIGIKLNPISFMIGGNYKGFQAYYIYDLHTSKKGNGSWSHELSFVYVLPPKHYKYSCPIIYW